MNLIARKASRLSRLNKIPGAVLVTLRKVLIDPEIEVIECMDHIETAAPAKLRTIPDELS
jgi:hypothetical protein